MTEICLMYIYYVIQVAVVARFCVHKPVTLSIAISALWPPGGGIAITGVSVPACMRFNGCNMTHVHILCHPSRVCSAVRPMSTPSELIANPARFATMCVIELQCREIHCTVYGLSFGCACSPDERYDYRPCLIMPESIFHLFIPTSS